MTAENVADVVREMVDGMLPDAFEPCVTEWYELCDRRFAVDKIKISGDLARAIVDAMVTEPTKFAHRIEAAHAREVNRAVANDRVRDVHTCHDQCTKTELCRMTRRAEAAEALVTRWREEAG